MKLCSSADCESFIDLCHHSGAIYDQPTGKGWDVPEEFGGDIQDEQPHYAARVVKYFVFVTIKDNAKNICCVTKGIAKIRHYTLHLCVVSIQGHDGTSQNIK